MRSVPNFQFETFSNWTSVRNFQSDLWNPQQSYRHTINAATHAIATHSVVRTVYCRPFCPVHISLRRTAPKWSAHWRIVSQIYLYVNKTISILCPAARRKTFKLNFHLQLTTFHTAGIGRFVPLRVFLEKAFVSLLGSLKNFQKKNPPKFEKSNIINGNPSRPAVELEY